MQADEGKARCFFLNRDKIRYAFTKSNIFYTKNRNYKDWVKEILQIRHKKQYLWI